MEEKTNKNIENTNKGYCWVVKSVNSEGAIIYNKNTDEERSVIWSDFASKKVSEKHKLSTKDKLKQGKDGKYRVKGSNTLFIAWFLVGLLSVGCAMGVYHISQQPEEEKVYTEIYIEDDKGTQVNETPGQTQILLNSAIEVKKQTLQKIGFKNVNKGKTQEVKIRLEKDKVNEYIFESPKIPYGKSLVAGVLNKNVPVGEYDAIAEVYTYAAKGKKINQTNFNIKIYVR